ncbi:MAG: redoxin domain-containing protein [Chitinophagales bacterium]
MKILSKLAPSLLIICCLMMGFTFQIQAQMVGGTVGSIAPNIELPDQYGNKISLSGLRGNLVLVRFWKSGDPNSRATNSNIFALHQKYKSASFQTAKGFQVFMVSLDSRLDKWKMALQEDQLPENYHVNDIYSKYVAPYGVRNLPANFLLDENGIIIANTKSMAELDQELSKRAKVYAGTTTTVSPTTLTTVNSTPTIYSDLVNTSDRPTPSTFNQPETTIANVSSAESTYMIQLGAFKNLDINKFLDASEYGFVTAEDAGNGVQRALLGKFNSPEDVVSTLSKLRDKGYPDAFPVEYKNNDRRIIGKKETTAIASKMGITIADAPVSTATPETMSVNTTQIPSTTNIVSTTNTNTTTNSGSTQYEYPFSTINTNSNPITSIPDDAISTTYHSGGSTVITTSTTSTNGNIATHNSSGNTTTGNTTLVPSEIPVFTGGVNPATTYNNNQGTYYDSDAYELSWYPSEPSHAQPNIIESPYYNENPISKDPNGVQVPNYDNNNNGWQQQGWSNSTQSTTNGQWNTSTQPNTNGQWNTSTQPNTNGQWDMNNQAPATSNYTEPNNQQLDQSLDSYLNSYDFSSVDDNSDRSTSTNKKKKKKAKKSKKKK